MSWMSRVETSTAADFRSGALRRIKIQVTVGYDICGMQLVLFLLQLLAATVVCSSVQVANTSQSDLELTSSMTIQTKSGKFRGILLSDGYLNRPFVKYTNLNEVVAFLGIRYASPPVKRLRFMPPTAYLYNKSQVHDAQKFGPICVQRFPVDLASESKESLELSLKLASQLMPKSSFATIGPLLRRLAKSEQSEDCLNLNVYAPLEGLREQRIKAAGESANDANKKLPVMVVVHGESFDFGAGNTINAFKFVQENKVIVVTFNYRLNIFGFPPKLSGGSRGNLGLMDQVAALHWVKENIEAFGGWPGNVTLAGSKRAATMVGMLMLSPLAKGLFGRVILEDGSALTPVVAAELAAWPQVNSGSSLASVQQLQVTTNNITAGLQMNSAGIRYLRILAKLNDCPIHLPPMRSASHLYANLSSNANSKSLQQPSSLKLQIGTEEAKMNALTFECLRYKPIESISERIPLELLQLSPTNGDISMAARWLRLANQTTLELPESDFAMFSLNSSDFKSKQQMVTVNAQLVRSLVASATQIYHTNTLTSGQEANLELLSAIYMPSTSNARPLFAPVIDSTIMTDDEVTKQMLRPTGAFGQRDLLIGLTRQKLTSPQLEDPNPFGLRNPFNERITRRLESVGVTHDQAIEMVGLFVRSFYRYHNQEITNSVIDHYMSLLESRRKFKGKIPGLINETDSVEKMKADRQVAILELLLEAFEDALINTPVIKTAVAHSIRQLDPLADAFVWGQLEQFKSQSSRLNLESENQRPGSRDNSEGDLVMQRFVNFSSKLMSDSSWPLEMYTNQQPEQVKQDNQPKGTFLYEMNSNGLSEILMAKLNELKSFLANRHNTSGWHMLIQILEKVLHSVRFKSQDSISLLCGLEFDYEDKEELCKPPDELDKESTIVIDLKRHLKEWICTRFNLMLSSFVTSGHLIGDVNRNNMIRSLHLQVDKFELRCLTNNSTYRELNEDQSNQLYLIIEAIKLMDDSCANELLQLALDFVAGNSLDLNPLGTTTESIEPSGWSSFNIFTQQIATLPEYNKDNQFSIFKMNQISEKSVYITRLAFWSNFIPALNCSKTQPVIPSYLLMGNQNSFVSQSPLVSTSLAFSCQMGSKTPLDLIGSLAESISSRLNELKTSWLSRKSGNSSRVSNHHSPRMANIGLSFNMSAEEPANSDQPSDGPTNGKGDIQQSTGGQNPSQLNTSSSGFNNFHGFSQKATISTVALIACVLLITVTIASSACAAMRRKRRKSTGVEQDSQDIGEMESNIINVQVSDVVNSVNLVSRQGESSDNTNEVAYLEAQPGQLGIESHCWHHQIQQTHREEDHLITGVYVNSSEANTNDTSTIVINANNRFHTPSNIVTVNGYPNGICEHQTQPIMMPILSTNDGSQSIAEIEVMSHQFHVHNQAVEGTIEPVTTNDRLNGRLESTNNERTGSCNEMNRQFANSLKKRVKISEPQRGIGQNSSSSTLTRFSNTDDSYQLSRSEISSADRPKQIHQSALYCPVHRKLATGSMRSSLSNMNIESDSTRAYGTTSRNSGKYHTYKQLLREGVGNESRFNGGSNNVSHQDHPREMDMSNQRSSQF